MNNRDRRANATATFGLTGVGSAAAMRHVALEQAYKKGKRPPVLQELKMIRQGTKGRGLYGAGMLTGAVSAPAAVGGLNTRLTSVHKKEKSRRSFFAEGASGVRDSITESTNTVKAPPPARLALANYLGGGVVTAGAGALTNHRLKKIKIPGAAKASMAAMAGVTAGASTLPVQSKIMTAMSGNKYETTAHGVRRKKTKAIPASRMATTVDARGVPTPVGKAAWKNFIPAPPMKSGAVRAIPRSKVSVDSDPTNSVHTAYNMRNKKIGGLDTDANTRVIRSVGVNAGYRRRGVASHLLAAAEKRGSKVIHDTNRSPNGNAWAHAMDKKRGAVPDKSHRELNPNKKQGDSSFGYVRDRGKVATMTSRAGRTGIEPPLSRSAMPPIIRPKPAKKIDFGFSADFGKAYYGEDMSRAKKRSMVAAVTGLPVAADIAQAGLAARMAPPPLRKKTAAQVYGGGQVGGLAGTAAGAYGAAALARRSIKFEAGTVKVNDALDSGKAKVRNAVGLAPKSEKPSLVARALRKTPGSIQRGTVKMAKPLAGHGKVAAVGGLIGGAAGGMTGSQTGYGFALRAEDRYKAKVARSSQSARHGSRVAKADAPKIMTPREQTKLRRAKHHNAVSSQVGGAIGLTALAATLGSKVPTVGRKNAARLAKVPVPLLTAGAGLSGLNSFGYASIQNKEASHKIKKSFVPGTGWVKAQKLAPAQVTHMKDHLKPSEFNFDDMFAAPKNRFAGRGIHNTYAHRSPSSASGRKIWDDHPTPRDGKVTTSVIPAPRSRRTTGAKSGPEAGWGGDAAPDGKGGGRIRINQAIAPEKHATVRAHEMAHLAPKRNPTRLSTMQRNDVLRGREEGRADWMAGRSSYPGNKEFHTGYDHVQTKMRAAGAKTSPGFKPPPVPQRLPPLPGISKGLIPGIRRAPRVVRGGLRQTRTPSTGAVRTSYTRGGIR